MTISAYTVGRHLITAIQQGHLATIAKKMGVDERTVTAWTYNHIPVKRLKALAAVLETL